MWTLAYGQHEADARLRGDARSGHAGLRQELASGDVARRHAGNRPIRTATERGGASADRRAFRAVNSRISAPALCHVLAPKP
jgi:hypothetical protein